MEKYRVGIIGATGLVGQMYIHLLRNHPWMQVSYLAASPRSAGKTYSEVMYQKWQMEQGIPVEVGRLTIRRADQVQEAVKNCDFVFSAVALGDQETRELEEQYAAAGIPVVSNNSAHRMTADVPMVIPEVNPEHLAIIPVQQKKRGWSRGFIAVKPNCGIQSYMIPIGILKRSGFKVKQIITTNLQALSGAGYPGVSAMDVIDNLVPIPGEEEKNSIEPLKILGNIQGKEIRLTDELMVSAHAVRVPVIHGHLSNLSIAFEDKVSFKEVISALESFSSLPVELDLPSAPDPVVQVKEGLHPQSRKDRDFQNGMGVTVGRVRECSILDMKFSTLAHNTRRGAAGGAVLIAELLIKQGYIKKEMD